MAVEYLGLSEINGPLVVLEGVQGAAYDEIVEMTVGGTTRRSDVLLRSTGIKPLSRCLREQTVWPLEIPIQG